jgi:kynurenine 3-monooxygenase
VLIRLWVSEESVLERGEWLMERLADTFLAETVPMKARMIHHVDGRLDSQLYDPIRGQVGDDLDLTILSRNCTRLIRNRPLLMSSRWC